MTDLEITPPNPETSTAESFPPKPKRVRGSAINRLCRDTAQTVRDNSDKLAKPLLDHTIKGDMRCAKLLLDLLEKHQQKTKRHSNRALKIIEALANEPQWQEPLPGEEGYGYHRPWNPTRVLIAREDRCEYPK